MTISVTCFFQHLIILKLFSQWGQCIDILQLLKCPISSGLHRLLQSCQIPISLFLTFRPDPQFCEILIHHSANHAVVSFSHSSNLNQLLCMIFIIQDLWQSHSNVTVSYFPVQAPHHQCFSRFPVMKYQILLFSNPKLLQSRLRSSKMIPIPRFQISIKLLQSRPCSFNLVSGPPPISQLLTKVNSSKIPNSHPMLVCPQASSSSCCCSSNVVLAPPILRLLLQDHNSFQDPKFATSASFQASSSSNFALLVKINSSKIRFCNPC